MSNPNEAPQPQQPGAQPPQPGNVPPAGYQPPQGYQPPPSYQAPPSYQQPAPGYQQPGQPAFGAPAGPNAAPPAGLGYAAPARNTFGLHFNNVAQRFRDTTGVPQQLSISYWLWVAAAALGVLASFINIFTLRDVFGGMMVGAGIVGLIFSLVFAALYVFIAIRLKEGSRWARLVLTILGAFAVISLLLQVVTLNLNFIGSAVAVAAAVLMWLPESRKHFV
ncbi:hypothetical protein KNN17_12035 [Arthrobacter bambusae]|jgi:hypothetical protein|uniref:hypothetical protein n=1 Tax=Arthrobacter bambusae TaxID=1338426 RepID=UPI001F50A2E1|nr:hypothetical protein [Arthrobacter bambusae]MCI0142306.1 hypothetical protein [Arthrobacter bambusae]